MDTQELTQEPDSLTADLAAAMDHIEAGGQAPDEPELEIDIKDDVDRDRLRRPVGMRRAA